MNGQVPVFWGEGMLLAPHHFQQMEQNRLHDLQARQNWFNQPNHGVIDFQFDHDLIRNGTIKLERLSILLPNGRFVCAPSHGYLPTARSLNELPHNASNHCCIYLTWPCDEGHITTEHLPRELPKHHSLIIQTRMIADLHGLAEPIEVQFQFPLIQLAFEQEITPGYWAIPIARLIRSDHDQWHYDNEWLPIAINLSFHPSVRNQLSSITETIKIKIEQLRAQSTQNHENSIGFSSSDISQYLLLRVLTVSYPRIRQLLIEAYITPQMIYSELSNLIAELMVFSNDFDVEDMPCYAHQDFSKIFFSMVGMLKKLLSIVLPTRIKRFSFQEIRSNLYSLTISDGWIDQDIDYYLSIRGEAQDHDWAHNIPSRVKIGAPDDVQRILHTALPGIRLIPVNLPPTGLSILANQYYFQLDRQDSLFLAMQTTSSAYLYAPPTMQHCQYDFIAVRRSQGA